MQRTFLPSVLASLGLILIIWASTMPLFEWDVNTTDHRFAPTDNVEVNLSSSPWVMESGESLKDSYYILTKVSVWINRKECLNLGEGGLDITIIPSPNNKLLGSLATNSSRVIPWLMYGALPVIALSGFYIWRLAPWHENRSISALAISVTIILVLFCFSIGIFRVVGPHTSIDYFGQVSYECHGALILNARLSKTYYEILVAILVGILAEVGALGIMLRQLLAIARSKKESPKSVAG